MNELSANFPPQYNGIYCAALIRLTQAVLELQVWSTQSPSPDRPRRSETAARESKANQSFSNTIWPASHTIGTRDNKLISTTDSATQENMVEFSTSITSGQQMVRLWVDAFCGLPKSLTYEPLFRNSCLTTHWPYTTPHSGTSNHLDQGALLIDIITLGLRASSLASPGLCESNMGLVSRLDLHPIWYQFVFSTLYCWGRYTPQLTRAVVQQICTTLNALGRQFVERPGDLSLK